MTRRELLLGLLPGLIPGGAVEGGDALYLPHGDILNVRNIQGGTADDPNLDIGAGDGKYHRGILSLNYDVGQAVVIYDGHKNPVISVKGHYNPKTGFDSRTITFHGEIRHKKKPH